jgi:hypothetical protein
MHTRLLRYTVLALGAPLVLAACGGGSSSSTAAAAGASGSTTTVKGATSRTALSDCLKQHGVTLPAGFGSGGPPSGGTPPSLPAGATPGSPPAGGTPGSLPAGVDQQKLQSAFKACGGTGNGFPGGGQNRQAFQAYTSCLGDHGVKVASGKTPGTFDRNSAAFVAANKVCAALLPKTTPTTTPSN